MSQYPEPRQQTDPPASAGGSVVATIPYRKSRTAPVYHQVENVPSTSLSLVEAKLALIVVLSMVAVPITATPPPTPTESGSTDPLVPAVRWPSPPVGVPPDPTLTLPAVPGVPADALKAWLPVITLVALACAEPFLVPSL